MNNPLGRSVMLVAILFLSACNLNESSLKRTSVGFKIEGLHYSSQSYSGETDKKGRFFYKPGEIVTFSVGATVLTSVKPHGGMTFSDLFGVSLPDTQMTVTEALTSENTNGFHRMANAMALLMLLDNDQNTASGIDVTAWQEPGKLPAINLNQDLYPFFYKTLASLAEQKNLVRERVIVSEPLMFIYKKAGIKVPAGIVVSDNYAYEKRYEYDEFGRLIKVFGKDKNFTNFEMEFDKHGRMSEFLFSNNWEWQEVLFRITYDEEGLEKNRYEKLSAVIDKNDPLWESSDKRLDAFYGPFQLGTTIYTNHDNERIAYYDKNMDGSPESITYRRRGYDSEGNLTLIRNKIDSYAYGIIGGVVEDVRTYDENGNIHTRVTPEKMEIYSHEFYKNGAIHYYSTFTQENESDWHERILNYNPDGTVRGTAFRAGNGDAVESISFSQYEYDESGRKILYSTDSNGDGIPGAVVHYTYTDTPSGLLADYEARTYSGSKLSLASVITRHHSYDAAGHPVSVETINDYDADGTPNSVYKVLREFAADGAVLSEVTFRDYDGDGVFNGSPYDDYERQHTTDALAYLIEFNTPREILSRIPGDNEPNDFWLAQLPFGFGLAVMISNMPSN
jgi:hypothetical protein